MVSLYATFPFDTKTFWILNIISLHILKTVHVKCFFNELKNSSAVITQISKCLWLYDNNFHNIVYCFYFILYKFCKHEFFVFVSDVGGNKIYDSTQSCRLRCASNNIAPTHTTAIASETPVFAECECHMGCLQTATCCPDYGSYCMLGKLHCNIFICLFIYLFLHFYLFMFLLILYAKCLHN